ncbi:hypothetical protein AAL_03536 [Moelleriella libera RCEF 2490]|uniref:Uncharacterized protein n=1 Tax=Moelleriella libera RCEF 2490 TaxID=1081109 RepID=A0A162IRP8_9HYPO|nr:hypothetical protein AAL_03536 [Moelleriella libera RCEF 2490]
MSLLSDLGAITKRRHKRHSWPRPTGDPILVEFERLREESQNQGEHIQHLREESQDLGERVQHQREKSRNQGEQIQHLREESQNQGEQIQHLKEESQNLGEQIQHQREKSQNQGEQIQHLREESQNQGEQIQHLRDQIHQLSKNVNSLFDALRFESRAYSRNHFATLKNSLVDGKNKRLSPLYSPWTGELIPGFPNTFQDIQWLKDPDLHRILGQLRLSNLGDLDERKRRLRIACGLRYMKI